MEFSRRGPATDGAADCHRCPDPQPHGDAMLVMRDALLWQLHKDRLRQEIIMAELAKIERAMALRAVSGHHSTPMPWDSTPQYKGPGFGWEHYIDVGEENDVKLPNNDKRQSAESRFWNPDAEDRAEKCWNPCKCRVNSGEHNSAFDEQKLRYSSENVPPNKASPVVKWELTGITIPVKKLKPPMSPRKKKPPMKWSCAVCQVQVNSEQDIQKHCGGKKHQSNIATLESSIKAIGGQKAKKATEPSLGTDQIKTSMVRWSCSTCKTNGTCQSDLEEHLKGTRHQQNIIALCKEGSNNNIVENIAPLEAKSHESDVPQHPEKPPLAGCSICQVICGRESDLEIHLKGKRHLKKITALCKEGSNNNIVENIAPHEAKLHEGNVPQHAEKPPLAGCSICQVICGRASDLKIHLKGKRHLKKIQALFEESNNKAINSESQKANLNLDSGLLHGEKMNCELDWERHQLNVQTLSKIINQEENNPPEIVKDQTPSSEWDCTMCQAKCNSKAHFQNHCTSRKHQQRTQVILSEGNITKTGRTHVILSEGDIVKMGNLHAEASCKEGSNNDMAKNVGSQEVKSHERNAPAHESPSVQSCSICQGICNCESDLDIYPMSKRIRAVVEKCKNMAMNSESQKEKLNPDGVPQHVEETSCKSNWESYPSFTDETLQPMDDRALREEVNQDKINPPETAKDQTPSSEWDCAMCQAKCNSKAQYEDHCISRKHQRRTQVMLGKGDSTKTGSLETADELPSDGSDSKNELPPEKVEEQKALNL